MRSWSGFNRIRVGLKQAQLKKIGLPHDGETFVIETLEELRDLLIDLKALGYRFPESVIDEVNRMIKEGE